MVNIYEKLMLIQNELKCPKDQFNSFGKYHYRSTESILEGLKSLLLKHKATLIISDEIVQVGERYYVKATAKLVDSEKGIETVISTSYAREEETKKGMDGSQITGSTSSYARKYALNGLFAIDDTKDSDSLNTHGKEHSKADTSRKQASTTSNKKVASNNQTAFKCSECGVGINQAVKTFSEKKYGKPLCMDCQKKQ